MNKVIPVDHTCHFIVADLWLNSLRDASWKCHLRLMVQREWGERGKRICIVEEGEKQRGMEK